MCQGSLWLPCHIKHTVAICLELDLDCAPVQTVRAVSVTGDRDTKVFQAQWEELERNINATPLGTGLPIKLGLRLKCCGRRGPPLKPKMNT